MAAKKHLVPLDMQKNEIQNAVIQNLAAAPSSPVKGQKYFDTVANAELYYDGTNWITVKTTTATPTTTTIAGAASAGSSNGFAKDDHTHAGPGFGTVTSATSFGAAASSGTATTVAHSDHTHGTPTHDAAAHSAIPISALSAATADFSAGGFKITNVATPVSGTDAVNKNYVDAAALGLDVKASVRAATTAAGTLSSSFANGSVIDGVTLATGDRILIKNQAAGAENGIYIVAAAGAPTRATDFNSSTNVTDGAFTFVEQGTTLAATGWILTTQGTITPGSTAMTFTQFSASGATYTASNGVTLSGSNFSFAPLASGGLQTAAGGASILLQTNSGLALAAGGLAVGAGTGISVGTNTVSIDTTVVARKYSVLLSTSATSYTVTHNLGTLDVIVQVYAVSDGSEVLVDQLRATTNTVTINFASAPSANAYRVVVIG